MKTLKTILRAIGKTMLWILYLAVTGKERQAYSHAKHVRREVLDVENDMFGTEYTLGRELRFKELPYRDFMTWKEFRQRHKF